MTQTNQYDPNPRPWVKLHEWHLTAATPSKTKMMEFVALFRLHRTGGEVGHAAKLRRIDGGYVLTAELSDGQVVVALLPTEDATPLTAESLRTTGTILIQRRHRDGSVTETLELDKDVMVPLD